MPFCRIKLLSIGLVEIKQTALQYHILLARVSSHKVWRHDGMAVHDMCQRRAHTCAGDRLFILPGLGRCLFHDENERPLFLEESGRNLMPAAGRHEIFRLLRNSF